MSSEVTDLIAALRSGELSLDDVAERFRSRQWPVRTRPDPQSYLELAAAAQRDPEPDLPGSFDDVDAAHDLGELSDDEFMVLQEAALEGMRRHGTRPVRMDLP